MDSWGRFNEKSIPNIEYFDSKLNKEGITDEDHKYAGMVWYGKNLT